MQEMYLATPGSNFGVNQRVVTSNQVGQNTVQIGGGFTSVDNYRMWTISGNKSFNGTHDRGVYRCTFNTGSPVWVKMGDYPSYISNGPSTIAPVGPSAYWVTRGSASAFYVIGNDTWKQLANITDNKLMSTGASGHSHRGSVFRLFRVAGGGNAVVARYDPINDAHSLVYEFDTNFGDLMATCRVGSRIYFFPTNIGVPSSNEWGYFDLTNTTGWVSCGVFPAGVSSMHAVADSDKIHLFGAGSKYNEVYTFHLRDNYVLRRPNLIRSCSNTAIIVVNNKALLWGGVSNNTVGNVGYTDFLEYDLDPIGGYFNR